MMHEIIKEEQLGLGMCVYVHVCLCACERVHI